MSHRSAPPTLASSARLLALLFVLGALAEALPAAEGPGRAASTRPAAPCARCHQEPTAINRVWREDVTPQQVDACRPMTLIWEAVSSIHISIDRTDATLRHLEEQSLRVKALREKLREAEGRFNEVAAAPLVDDRTTLEELSRLNLAMQKIWRDVFGKLDELKARRVLGVLTIATTVLLMSILAGYLALSRGRDAAGDRDHTRATKSRRTD